MTDTILIILWTVTFIAGWICVYLNKKRRSKVLHRTALIMFGVAIIVSAYNCIVL